MTHDATLHLICVLLDVACWVVLVWGRLAGCPRSGHYRRSLLVVLVALDGILLLWAATHRHGCTMTSGLSLAAMLVILITPFGTPYQVDPYSTLYADDPSPVPET